MASVRSVVDSLAKCFQDVQVVPAMIMVVVGWEEITYHAVHPFLPDGRLVVWIVHVRVVAEHVFRVAQSWEGVAGIAEVWRVRVLNDDAERILIGEALSEREAAFRELAADS